MGSTHYSEQNYLAIFDAVSDAIFVHDIETGKVLDMNLRACEMTGYGKGECARIKPGGDSEDAYPYTSQKALKWIRKAAEMPQLFEWRAKRRNGEHFWMEVNLKRVRIGGEDRILAFVRDNTERKEAELKVEESERKFRAIFEEAGNAILIADETGYIDCNPAAEKLFRCTKEEIIKRKLGELSPAVQPDGSVSKKKLGELITAARQGVPQRFEWRLVRSDGSLFDAEFSMTAIRLKGKTLLQIISHDITDRKQAAESIAHSEQKFRAIFETAKDAIFLIAEDKTFIDCNPAATELFGCSKEYLLRKKPYNFSPPVQPDGRNTEEKAAALFCAATQGTPQRFEWRHQKADGSEFDALVALSRFELDGKTVFQSIVQDISDKIKAVEALRNSEMRFRALVETTSDWIWEVDENDFYTYASPKIFDFLGYKAEEVVGRTPFDFMHPDEARRIREAFHAIKAERKAFYGLENMNLHKNGAIVIIETSGVPVFGKDGRFRGYRGIDRNITERKMLEQKFLQVQKMEAVGQLASGVAHEFNNILTAVIGYANLLLPQVENDSRGKAFAEKVITLSKQAAGLTQDLLAFSRKQTVQPKPVDLNEIVRKMANLLKWMISEDIELEMTLHRGVLPVMAVSGQIEQVLINLATNARDAMPGIGLFTVRTSVVDKDHEFLRSHSHGGTRGYVLISVSDNGAGMDEKTRARIFEPFFTTKEVGRGTGLGLATVYGIVKQHNGFINVHSEPGEGTTFNIYLPLINAALD